MTDRTPGLSRRWALLGVCALALAANAPALGNGFALDDRFIIVDNPRVTEPGAWSETFTTPYWPGTPGRLGLYRPLPTATYALEWRLWNGHPLPFHATNLLLHLLVTGLVFALLSALLAAVGSAGTAGRAGTAGAAAGAAVFAVHPVHVEAVANVVGRAELMAAAFVLGALLVYARPGLTRSRGRLWGGAAAVGLLYFLGLLSKEIAVTLPGLLLVAELARVRDAGAPGRLAGALRQALARWPVYAAAAAALGAYLWIRIQVLGTAVGNDAAGFFRAMESGDRLMTAVALWPEYLRLMLFPRELVADYSPAVLMPVEAFGVRVGAGLLTGLLVVLAGVALWRKVPEVGIGALWFSVAVLPVSNLVIPIGVLLAERTLYLPSVGLSLAVGGVGSVLWSTGRRRTAVGLLTGLVLLGAVRTWTRTPVWESTESVLENLVAEHPESFRSQWLIADRLRRQGRLDEALDHYRVAVRLVPGHYQLQVQAARAYLQAGDTAQAVAGFRAARDAVPELPEAHVFLMATLLAAGHDEEAIAAGREALHWHSDHRGVHHQMAMAFTRAGDYTRALEARRESLRLSGERASPLQRVHLAELLLRTDDVEAARRALDTARASARDPGAVPTLEALRSAVASADTAVLPYR